MKLNFPDNLQKQTTDKAIQRKERSSISSDKKFIFIKEHSSSGKALLQ